MAIMISLRRQAGLGIEGVLSHRLVGRRVALASASPACSMFGLLDASAPPGELGPSPD